jgi:hypothetical protein
MSQAGELNVVQNHPEIPTMFSTNSGTAIPIANELEILGTGAVSTSGATNVVTISVVGVAETLTGNSGGAVGPDGSNNINVVGDGTTIDVVGDAATHTLTISTVGSGVLETLTGNTGGAISPTSGNINTLGTGSITIAGSGSTLTTELTGLTDHAVLIGAGTATITKVGPDATSGIPLISQGSSTDPAFGTAVVAGGGTGDTSFTAYAPVCGGTTTTAALQSASSGISNSGYVLTSTGSSSLPTWQAASGGSAITTIDGDSGSISGTTVKIWANNNSQNCGSSVKFVNSGTVSVLDVTDSSYNTLVGNVAGNSHLSGNSNTGFGDEALTGLTSGNDNTAIGVDALASVSSGNGNTGIGYNSLYIASTGSYNIGLGYQAGINYLTSETQNILIGHNGVTGDSNVLRIGTQSSGTYAISSTYIAGITGATPTSANTPQVVLCDNTGNLAVISSSTSGYVLTSNGISSTPSFQATASTSITLDGDSGSATGTTLTISGGSTGLTTSASGTTVDLTGTLNVGHGGTGDSSFTAYMPICGGTTSTAALQSVATGTAGYVLTYVSSSALPTWQTPAAATTPWTDESTNFSPAANNGYFVTGTATATLPASPSQGNTIHFSVDTTQILTITANTGQVIRIGSAVSASAGTAANNARGDSVTLVYRSSDAAWIASSVIGTWTVT